MALHGACFLLCDDTQYASFIVCNGLQTNHFHLLSGRRVVINEAFGVAYFYYGCV